MLLAFSIAPATPDPTGSYAEAVAAALRVVRDSGLPHDLGSMFTTIEGEWDEVMDVVKGCVDAMGPYGDRVSLVMKADIRAGRSWSAPSCGVSRGTAPTRADLAG